MIAGEISISLHGSVIVAIALVLLGMGAAFGYYRFTLPPLPPRRRVTLSVLRGISLSLLLLLLFEPIIRIVHRDDQAPRIAVLIDDSQSIGITDRTGSRADQVRRWLDSHPLSGLPAPASPEYFLFATRITKGFSSMPETLAFNGQSTDMASALSQVKQQVARDNIRGVVIVSDGQYTVGRNPLYDAQDLGVPVYTIGVGDTAEQKDVLVSKVVTNAIAYAGSSVPIEATIKSSGYAGERVEVTVSDGTGILDRSSVTLSEGTSEQTVRLHVEPKDEGTMRYTVSVSRLPQELTEQNNNRSIFIKVLRSKMQVLIVAGAPSPDVAAVRQALSEDGHFAVRAYVQKRSGGFYDERYSRTTVDSADCLVFIDFPMAGESAPFAADLRDVLARLKKPLLFIAGRTLDYNALRQFEQYLPFTWTGVNSAESQAFPAVDDRYRLHPLITLEGNATSETWQSLPPIFKSNTVFRAKPEANTLAGVVLQGVRLNEPLVAASDINRQRTFGITGYNVWQWRLTAQGNSATAQFFPLLMSNAVRWLTTKEDNRRVHITPVKQVFTTAEPAEFTAQVYDDQLHPVDNAEVDIEIRKGSESAPMVFRSAGSGMYEGSVEGLAEGEYTYSGKASVNGQLAGNDAGKFSIGNVNVEFLETKMNKPLLEQIAFRTGGTYAPISNSSPLAGEIANGIHLTSREIVEASEIELWNWKYLLGMMIALLGAEWLIRKLNGML